MRRAGAVIAALIAAPPAQAHVVVEGVSGFPGGLLHPLLVPAHALLLVTVGLLAGAQARGQRRMLVPLFPLALIGAVMLVVAAVAADSQTTILWLTAINGILLALARPLPLIVSAVLIAAGGVALMLDSVPALLSVRDTLLALGGTLSGALMLFVLFAAMSARLHHPGLIVARRIVGSWAAASALLVLALRLAR